MDKPDMDKLLTGLRACLSFGGELGDVTPLCESCPYCDDDIGTCGSIEGMLSDALVVSALYAELRSELADTLNDLVTVDCDLNAKELVNFLIRLSNIIEKRVMQELEMEWPEPPDLNRKDDSDEIG